MANETQSQKRQQALNIPHGIFVVDQLLKVKSDGQQVQVTLGWESPNEGINPTATLVMSANFAEALSKALHGVSKPVKKSR
jgi:hypothetical protein